MPITIMVCVCVYVLMYKDTYYYNKVKGSQYSTETNTRMNPLMSKKILCLSY